ncbi:LysR family transcriptional regulator substrate-binding protein [Corynebacterium sp. MSK004]|uniref:LysR family transcriptional regulator substrate-binding protein n=1 Tax=Corynebacterium TaxID=1716 RepID=UPI0008A5324B|nr:MULTISPECIES: LysR family transcriptional regulator substrate-binding protein [Corynebacterium]MDK8897868.1 LysR family transcriptional regulator substrate-binding protein [Corynebacterium sp. MSK004]OFM28364.1 LysR family transcriptional regulator [Corynebacterium sp. HMSC072A02]TRX38197.1 LysR family transcriptional regulator substrate-binding protein [Corynebacterium guaraldiae]
MLRLVFSTGTEPGKWFRRYRDSHPPESLVTVDADDAMDVLLAHEADLALTRLPDSRVDDSFHVVQLYEEAPGIAVPKDSVYAEVGEDVTQEDVAEEIVNYRIAQDGSVDVPALRTALQVVAANVGVAIAPRPLLKVLSKKQVVALGLEDPTVARTVIALVWRRADDGDEIQDFVGVAKGRTRNSSRNAAPKRSARDKAKAKQARRKSQEKPQRGSASKPLSKRYRGSQQRKRR